MVWLSVVFSWLVSVACFFFFNDTATTEIYTLSLHDALPILTPMVPHLCLIAYVNYHKSQL